MFACCTWLKVDKTRNRAADELEPNLPQISFSGSTEVSHVALKEINEQITGVSLLYMYSYYLGLGTPSRA